MPASESFRDIVRTFADAVAANFATLVAAQPEDQLKAPTSDLLRACGELWKPPVATRTEAQAGDRIGRPDIGVTVGGLLCGFVELKAPGRGARPESFRGRDRDQWQRFQALPNLIYTDGSEWSLYRSGRRVARARIADDVSQEGASGLDVNALAGLETLLRDFLSHNPTPPRTAKGLAEFLAPLARLLRDEVREALVREDSPVRRLADEWQGILFAEGDDEQFTDAYAQTLTYSLLLARFEGAEELRRAFAVDALRQSGHTFLAAALDLLETARDELSMPVALLERAIDAVDASMLPRDEDPWLYFYEHFLGAYDANLRKNRGVYYTPVEVVRAQVRFAAELLRDRFGKRLGFASDDVVVLDPACGTGTYPLAVLGDAAKTVRETLGPGAVPEQIRSLAERLHAFEILVGPYSVAHLRVSQSLRELGVTDVTPSIYLTDTLESPNASPEFTASLMQEPLTEERRRAQRIKEKTRVFVCLGNPPYDREQHDPNDDRARRKGGWVRYGDEGLGAAPAILEDFLAPVREAGGGVHLKNLYNDYVYFWRWALWKVLDSTGGPGIVTFISAASYLHGPAFAGMRRKMREVFDDLWIIDLEGDSRGARKTENVFAIQTPVAIAIGVRNGQPAPYRPARVRKARLTGTSAGKLAELDCTDTLDGFGWHECATGWDEPFWSAGAGDYFNWPNVTDAFPWQHSGVELKRTWPIGEVREVLTARWRGLVTSPPDGRADRFKETRDRRITSEPPPLPGHERQPPISTLGPGDPVPEIAPYAFRSFDRQFFLRDARVGDRNRPPLHLSHGPKQAYITGMLTGVIGTGPVVTAAAEIPDRHHFRGSYSGKDVIPLYRDADATEPNVTGGLLERIGEAHGNTPRAERLFAYAYGVLAQPAYTERFWDELEQPPPRLPITKDAALFARVADLGERLLHLHTYAERFRAPGRVDVPQGEARCTKDVGTSLPRDHSYDEEERVLRVGEGEFGPVAPEVYRYSVSGFQVVKSWLDRRKLQRSGRKSSDLDKIRPERWTFTQDFVQLLWVLEETLRLQPEGAELLAEVCASDVFSAADLPTPTAEERRAPAAGPQPPLFD